MDAKFDVYGDRYLIVPKALWLQRFVCLAAFFVNNSENEKGKSKFDL